MTYEAWRITYQDSEQAARAAYSIAQSLQAERDGLSKEKQSLIGALEWAVAILEEENLAPDSIKKALAKHKAINTGKGALPK